MPVSKKRICILAVSFAKADYAETLLLSASVRPSPLTPLKPIIQACIIQL